MKAKISWLAVAVLLMTSTVAAQQPTPAKPARTGHVQTSGVNYYYAVYGSGAPLLLIHGGLGSSDMFAPVLLPALVKSRQVIVVDLQGHGRSTLGSSPLDYGMMANDVARVVTAAGFDTVDVMGYSMGGMVGLRFAIQHPARVRRLVVVSAPYAQNGFFPEMLPQQAAVGAAMAAGMKDTPMYQSYVKVAPRPEDFPRLLDRVGEVMRRPFDWSAEVKQLKGPVMLVYGDADMIRPEHIVSFFQLLGGGLKDAGWQREHMSPHRLAILPNLTHYEMVLSPSLAPAVLPFLNGEPPAPVWTGQ